MFSETERAAGAGFKKEDYKMRFYYTNTKGQNARELTMDEVHQHLSECQIEEAIEAKQEDPHEEVSYMTVGGYIICEF